MAPWSLTFSTSLAAAAASRSCTFWRCGGSIQCCSVRRSQPRQGEQVAAVSLNVNLIPFYPRPSSRCVSSHCIILLLLARGGMRLLRVRLRSRAGFAPLSVKATAAAATAACFTASVRGGTCGGDCGSDRVTGEVTSSSSRSTSPLPSHSTGGGGRYSRFCRQKCAKKILK